MKTSRPKHSTHHGRQQQGEPRDSSPALRPGLSVPRLNEAASALIRVLTFDYPADAVLSRYFRERPQLGQQDRAFIAEAVFGVLRRKFWLDHLAPQANVRQLLLLWLARIAGHSSRELGTLCSSEELQWLNSTRAQGPLSLTAEADLPPWVIEQLLPEHGEDFVRALGRALQEPAPLDLRVNTLNASREEVLAKLRSNDIIAEPTPLSPLGLRLRDKPALNRNPLFAAGKFEVQDEGSQLLGYLLAPRRGELVVDFCAGAGGKTLMLGAMMNSQGRLYAFDVSEKRLANLKPRLKRSGLSNVHPLVIAHENDAKVKRLAGKIDRVLVDAPCSGLGTLRRNPDLKFRQSPQSVAELTVKQAAILASAARLVKPGGRLVYATCSLLAVENRSIVEAFLAAQPQFAALNCGELLQRQGIAVGDMPQLQLWPQIHHTDGFFAAAFERRS
ncbi:MAG: RsmB/NOP family class I SAM-dependent RNA methyltransferase [Burkholderiales bacterium]|nr:RsmB/NOP family class I SAM-dependent RNA methyltransferase [Burkholderiales bacterium]